MSCTKCGSNIPCGCKDGPFTTVPGCPCPPDANCPVPQKCVELIDQACVYQNDYGIVDTNFPEGASTAQIMQMISLFLTNPGCISPASACQSVPYIYPYLITPSSIAVAWVSSPTATNYQVEWKHISQVIWTQMPLQIAPVPNTAVISPLLPNETYFIKVNTFCTVGNCYSVTLRINTKP